LDGRTQHYQRPVATRCLRQLRAGRNAKSDPNSVTFTNSNSDSFPHTYGYCNANANADLAALL
jgi:hypothetical protein